jgi:hypothetical protein
LGIAGPDGGSAWYEVVYPDWVIHSRVQAAGTATGSDHADCQLLAVGGTVAAQDAALVIDGRLPFND